MTWSRIPLRLVIVAVLALCVAPGSLAADPTYKVIVHPANPATSVSRDFLRDAYLKKVSEWSDGSTVLPIDLTSRYPERERFTRAVLRKTPAQLRSYWNQRIFSGKGVPPPEAESPADVVAYVLANPGAVGYVPAATDTERVKVIQVR